MLNQTGPASPRLRSTSFAKPVAYAPVKPAHVPHGRSLPRPKTNKRPGSKTAGSNEFASARSRLRE
ncbi:MAG: hypothetical protein AMJ75_01065 [Phycisphaerae bacterium SM1_79]|nr:MAG: hypothetical protein AMJ75_01065 [Phycisphaerae bacterium SM1_79]